MGNAGQDPTYRHIEQKIIEPLLAFRQKVQPLNQTHNDCIQQFTTIIMGLLTGSDGETALQGPGSDALATLIGKFLDGEQQLAGTDPLTLEGRLQDAAAICEQHAHNLQATVKSFSASRGNGNPSMFASISALFDDGDNPADEGPDDPDDIAIGELMEYQSDMQAPINEPLPATPDINALPANVPPNPSLDDNAGFIQNLGINEPDVDIGDGSGDGGLTATGEQYIQDLKDMGVTVYDSNDDPDLRNYMESRGATSGGVTWFNGVPGDAGPNTTTVILGPEADDAAAYEEYLHVQRAAARGWLGLDPEDALIEEIEVEEQVLAEADELNMTPAKRAALQQNINSYRQELWDNYQKTAP